MICSQKSVQVHKGSKPLFRYQTNHENQPSVYTGRRASAAFPVHRPCLNYVSAIFCLVRHKQHKHNNNNNININTWSQRVQWLTPHGIHCHHDSKQQNRKCCILPSDIRNRYKTFYKTKAWI